MRDLNLFRPDHPGFTGAASPPSQAAAGEAYTGDFNTKTVDATKFVGQIFADGVYTLPAELKESALGIARLLMEIEGANIKTVLPGLGLKDGDVSTEYVASYIMTLAMETYRPNNLQRVLNPRKFGVPREVESRFTNSFDTSKPLDEAGIAVARQIYGDNYDKGLGTTNPSDDLAFVKLMQKLLPPHQKGAR